MYEVAVFEKVFGKLIMNTYKFKSEAQMLLFKKMCEEDGVIVIVRKRTGGTAVTV
ncbi:hypothetical protein [Paenibacillus sp. ISL-20]|uniref:hypothetical protein n=1 Tax=Paenibacillus sp. ISL-20 TaxID=2819163 RepID=UPI001BE5BA0C|nr:hypothetical protein [Paenibacillus sp. ISL-20]MBT2759893.1 hypothetical protein [Paenibacillus sp. ISL-20]